MRLYTITQLTGELLDDLRVDTNPDGYLVEQDDHLEISVRQPRAWGYTDGITERAWDGSIEGWVEALEGRGLSVAIEEVVSAREVRETERALRRMRAERDEWRERANDAQTTVNRVARRNDLLNIRCEEFLGAVEDAKAAYDYVRGLLSNVNVMGGRDAQLTEAATRFIELAGDRPADEVGAMLRATGTVSDYTPAGHEASHITHAHDQDDDCVACQVEARDEDAYPGFVEVAHDDQHAWLPVEEVQDGRAVALLTEIRDALVAQNRHLQVPGSAVEPARPVSRQSELRRAREWARANGHDVAERGRLSAEVWAGYREAQRRGEAV